MADAGDVEVEVREFAERLYGQRPVEVEHAEDQLLLLIPFGGVSRKEQLFFRQEDRQAAGRVAWHVHGCGARAQFDLIAVLQHAVDASGLGQGRLFDRHLHELALFFRDVRDRYLLLARDDGDVQLMRQHLGTCAFDQLGMAAGVIRVAVCQDDLLELLRLAANVCQMVEDAGRIARDAGIDQRVCVCVAVEIAGAQPLDHPETRNDFH